MQEILELIRSNRYLEAIAKIKERCQAGGTTDYERQCEYLAHEYEQMLSYFCRNVDDPQRFVMYMKLSQQLLSLALNVYQEQRIRDERVFLAAKTHCGDAKLDATAVRQELEDFVVNIALAQVETPFAIGGGASAKSIDELYAEHHRFLTRVFRQLWLSPQMTSSVASDWQQLLLSPTIDEADACLLCSAMTLACLCFPDEEKWNLLMEVYLRTDSVQLRQRALVGWVTSLNGVMKCDVFNNVYERMVRISDERVADDLLSLQMQMIVNSSSADEMRSINEEMLPTLIKHSNLRINGRKIDIADDDPMDDILDPHKAERTEKEMERYVGRMRRMRQEGVDIFLDQFSHMKRFAFFYNIANWFMPFTPHHPELVAPLKKLRDCRFAQQLSQKPVFCDSDSYSLILGLASVYDGLPEEMRNMMKESEIGGLVDPGSDDEAEALRDSDVYVRQRYLHDLYRFTTLYTDARELNLDCFRLFFCDAPFPETIAVMRAPQLAKFLFKRKRYEDVLRVLDTCIDEVNDDRGLSLIYADSLRHQQRYAEAMKYYSEASMPEKQDEGHVDARHIHALKGLAYCSMELGDYLSAAEFYRLLHKLRSDEPLYELYYFEAAMHNPIFSEEIKDVYRFAFEQNERLPEDSPLRFQVSHLLARALMIVGKHDKAEAEYARLLPDDVADLNLQQHLSCAIERMLVLLAQKRVSDALALARQLLQKQRTDILSQPDPHQAMVERLGKVLDNDHEMAKIMSAVSGLSRDNEKKRLEKADKAVEQLRETIISTISEDFEICHMPKCDDIDFRIFCDAVRRL